MASVAQAEVMEAEGSHTSWYDPSEQPNSGRENKTNFLPEGSQASNSVCRV